MCSFFPLFSHLDSSQRKQCEGTSHWAWVCFCRKERWLQSLIRLIERTDFGGEIRVSAAPAVTTFLWSLATQCCFESYLSLKASPQKTVKGDSSLPQIQPTLFCVRKTEMVTASSIWNEQWEVSVFLTACSGALSKAETSYIHLPGEHGFWYDHGIWFGNWKIYSVVNSS